MLGCGFDVSTLSWLRYQDNVKCEFAVWQTFSFGWLVNEAKTLMGHILEFVMGMKIGESRVTLSNCNRAEINFSNFYSITVMTSKFCWGRDKEEDRSVLCWCC